MWKPVAALLFFPALVRSQVLSAYGFFQNVSELALSSGIDFTIAWLINDLSSSRNHTGKASASRDYLCKKSLLP
jgi:hypothetical protein